MKYRIEFRSSRYECSAVIQNTGGNFHDFDASDDADAEAKAADEWQNVLAKARRSKLRSVGFVRLARLPNASPTALRWTPATASR